MESSAQRTSDCSFLLSGTFYFPHGKQGFSVSHAEHLPTSKDLLCRPSGVDVRRPLSLLLSLLLGGTPVGMARTVRNEERVLSATSAVGTAGATAEASSHRRIEPPRATDIPWLSFLRTLPVSNLMVARSSLRMLLLIVSGPSTGSCKQCPPWESHS